MLDEFTTPSKDITEILSPCQHRALTALIFSGSTKKSCKTQIAEKRYSKPAQIFDTMDIIEDDQRPGKLLTYNEPFHSKNKSKHLRKSSTDEARQEKSKILIRHSRKISDADSVIYKITEEEIQKHRKSNSVRGSLPVLDLTPCTMYCKFCGRQVHTVLDFYSNNLPKKILSVFSSLMTCCQIPV